MVDNFENIKKYVSDLGIPKEYDTRCDLYFDIQLIRRGKDHPNMPAANYTFKTYYVDCLDNFDKYKDEIIKCCDMFGLRAYVAVNVKSKYKASLKTIQKYAFNLTNGESRKPWRTFASVCGEQDGEEKRWIVDCDDCDNLEEYLSYVREAIGRCDSRYDNPIVITIPTRSGYHVITHPFNLKKFDEECNKMGIVKPEIKKNHITLLYENVDLFKKSN